MRKIPKGVLGALVSLSLIAERPPLSVLRKWRLWPVGPIQPVSARLAPGSNQNGVTPSPWPPTEPAVRGVACAESHLPRPASPSRGHCPALRPRRPCRPRRPRPQCLCFHEALGPGLVSEFLTAPLTLGEERRFLDQSHK